MNMWEGPFLEGILLSVFRCSFSAREDLHWPFNIPRMDLEKHLHETHGCHTQNDLWGFCRCSLKPILGNMFVRRFLFEQLPSIGGFACTKRARRTINSSFEPCASKLWNMWGAKDLSSKALLHHTQAPGGKGTGSWRIPTIPTVCVGI